MKKNKKQLIVILTLVLLAATTLMGCSEDGMTEDYGDVKGNAAIEIGDMLEHENYSTNEESENSESNDVAKNRKIIETISLHAQTREFDALMEKLDEKIKKLGGYIETSSVSGNDYEYEEERYAELTVRVPAGKSEELTKFVSDNSTITSKEITTEDVTLSYVDLESRVSALETEKETLERLLANATTMEDVITIQERLTEVIYEIESVKSQLRTYDNLIDFTTITIRIDEVERVAIVEEQTVWQEIGTNLKQGFENVWNLLVRLFVLLVSSIPYLLVLAVIPLGSALIIVFFVKQSRKRKQSKKEVENKNEK